MNFKVKCTRVHEKVNPRFTVGKVYEVRDGKLFADKSCRFEAWCKPHNGNGDFKALRKWFKDFYEFELVEEHKTNYKVGDKVRVRSDLDLHDDYRMGVGNHHGWCAMPSMVAKAGKVVTIADYNHCDDCYHIAEDNGNGLRWTDEMFEGLVEEDKTSKFKFKVGDRVIGRAYDGKKHIGTVVCIKDDGGCDYGVEFDEAGVGFHNCGSFPLVAGNKPKRNNSLWFFEHNLEFAKENKPEHKKVEDNNMNGHKFKVGDMVRRTAHNNTHDGVEFKTGQTGKIVRVFHYLGHLFADVEINGKLNTGNNCDYLELIDPVNEKIVITHDGKTTTATMYCGDGTKKVATARCAPEDTFDFAFGANLAMYRLMESIENSKYTVVEVAFARSRRTYAYKTKDSAAKVGMKILCPVNNYGREIEGTIDKVIPGSTCIGTFPMSEMKEIEIKKAPEKFYNGKVVCIKTGYSWWTVGKIYEVKDGYITADDSCRYPNNGERYVDADDVRHAGNANGTKHNRKNEFIPIVE